MGNKIKDSGVANPEAGPENKDHGLFPIVGIGASAGGLEALELFFKNVPPDCGAAFVVVQHLDPTQKGMLPELLQRFSALPIHQIKDRTKVLPNCVYVIPPNADLSIEHGVLYISDPIAPRGLRLPIDHFFASLAADRHERAIGVILSGMGTDGTAGFKALKETNGLLLAQEPSSAKFDGMPTSAISMGLVDYVAPPGELPAKIMEFLSHAPLFANPKGVIDDKSLSALDKIVFQLKNRTGHDFSQYKKSTLYRRIERRMGIHSLDKIADYSLFLQGNPAELDLLFKELLIGVTSFFRDIEAWEKLKNEVLPVLIASRPPGTMLRAWVAGCSTGEEAYSLAMAFQECFDAMGLPGAYSLQIFATDLDQNAIEKARQGIYPASIESEVSPERLNRFFMRDELGYQIGKSIRERVVFATHNIIRDPPFTKLDLLSCRNLLIYLEPELQKKLLPLFHYSLTPGGVLFLGSAESIGGFTDLFDVLHGKEKLFGRHEGLATAQTMTFPSGYHQAEASRPAHTPEAQLANLETMTDKWVLEHFAPATVLVTGEGDILYSSARTGKYLEPPVGKANLNIFAMVRDGLRQALTGAFQKVRRDGGHADVQGIEVGTNGDRRFVDLSVNSPDGVGELSGKFLIVFSDSQKLYDQVDAKITGEKKLPRESARNKQLLLDIVRIRQEIESSRENMQSSQEELKSANEELQSTNEELQSTNEELQSTNEELTTSREEMQSLNEELQTVNAELSSKVEELSRSSADMKNLLNSTDIAIVFLDGELKVRRFTHRATNIVKLIPGDVGRPFTDLTSSLTYPELIDDAKEVLRTLVFCEKQKSTTDGRWYLVRIMPYRTLEDRIDGVVITFSDITTIKNLENKLLANKA